MSYASSAEPIKLGYLFDFKLPDGYPVPTHTHPKTERVTVLAGTFYIRMVGDHGSDEAGDADACTRRSCAG